MLTATGLNTYYGESHILRGVDVRIPERTAVGLLGRNGMGKTTLIRTLMGYVRAASGRVQWQGRDVTGAPPERMARLGIGYVPEGRGIFPNLSVRENLLVSARAGADGRREWTFDRVMATFPRLSERLANGGQQLSGGEQQMLSIGRALMTNPTLMILDEATEGLAPLIRKEIWNCLGGLKQTGLSMLVIDKNLKALCQIADHHYVLEKGHVVWQGSTEALKADWAQVQVHVGV